MRVVVNRGNASGATEDERSLYVVGGARVYVRARYFLAEIRSAPLKIARVHHRRYQGAFPRGYQKFTINCPSRILFRLTFSQEEECEA